MTTGQGTPPEYDWEDGAGPQEPERPALPAATPSDPDLADEAPISEAPRDFSPWAAPTVEAGTPDAPDAGQSSGRDGRLPAWAILGIVAVQGVVAVSVVALVLGAAQTLYGGPDADPSAAPTSAPATRSGPPATSEPAREPGTVTDSSGREVTDGTGGFDDPGTIGEHTVSWTVWTRGTLFVTPLEVDVAATLPGTSATGVVQDGYRAVLATYEVRYEGAGQLAPSEELWLTGETELTYFPDIAQGLVGDPMKQVGPLEDGETARFRSVFLVPEDEVDSFRLGLETFTGEVLYFRAT